MIVYASLFTAYNTHRVTCLIKKGLVLLILLKGFAAYADVSDESKKDSILAIILEAEEASHMNTIKTDVGAKIMALNDWAGEAVWNEPDLVQEVTEELIQYAIANHNDSLLSWSYHYLGISYYYMHYWNLSINTYQKALATAWAKESPTAGSFRAFCALNIGCNYEFLGDYDQAAGYYYESINLNEELGLPYVAAEAKLDVASLNIRMNNQEEARRNILEALEVLKQFNDSVRISEAYRMMSSVEMAGKNYAEAEYYFNNALGIGLALNDQERLVKIYQDYGDALFAQNKLQDAYATYKKALEYCIPSKFPATWFQVTGSLGKVQTALNQFEQAEGNLLIAFDGLSKLGATTLLLEIEQNLANLYAKNGNYQKFLHYYNLSMARKDTLAAIEKFRSIGESEVIYRTAQKDRQIRFQDLQLSNRKKQIILISTIAFLLLLGFIIVLRFLKKVRIKNKNLLERNIELSRQWDQLQDSYFTSETTEPGSTLFKNIYDLVVEKQEYTNPQITVDYLARELGTNNKYVSTAIKDKTGMNFNTFVNTYRIEKAKKELRADDSNHLTLEAIAENCGFNNNTTFYQTFKRNTGLTPTVYRNINP